MLKNMIEKTALRESLFRHLDGLVVAPIAVALQNSGILKTILDKKSATVSHLAQEFQANQGYLNIALRALASQGFLNYEVDNATTEVSITTNENSQIAFSLFNKYEDIVKALEECDIFTEIEINSNNFHHLEHLFEQFKNQNAANLPLNALEYQINKHLEGFLVGPLVVSLGMTGMFHKYFMETSFRPEEFHKEPEIFKKILDFFVFLDWFTENKGNYQFTDTGLFFAKRASAYGVTVSYLPMLKRTKELLFGNPNSIRTTSALEEEIHVNREMNVWGSGGAHATYFKVIDEIIIEIFNRPIQEQPKGILDMGCGNGAFLQHIFEVIERQTLRGKLLEEHPLFLVGADYNQAALKVTRANLIKADIWAKVIWGDISNPDQLAHDLAENYKINLSDLLNVRTFLDHNRIWESPTKRNLNRISASTGAFSFRGNQLANNEVEDNLLEYFQKWAKYVQQFGLLIIELHTIAPEITAKNIGKTAATAYDVTHGFSDQYIVEIDVLHKVAREAGLQPDAQFFKKFPNTEYATVSINLLKG